VLGTVPKGATVLNIHLRESSKNGPVFAALVRIAAEERRSLAGMAWILLLDGMKTREERQAIWTDLGRAAGEARR